MLEKSRGIRRGLETVLIMGALALALCLAAPRAAHAQNLQIFAVNPLDFGPTSGDNNEVTASCDETAALDPVLFYDNTVTTTAAIDVMLVTISAVGDADGGNRLEIQCKVDGTPCKTGNIGDDGAPKTGAGAPDGWVAGEFDDENEIVSYTWCVPIKKTKKNEHVVNLSLANGANGSCNNDVSLEQVNVVVEGYHAGASKNLGPQACKSVGVGEHNS
jgi:hypothetical protein